MKKTVDRDVEKIRKAVEGEFPEDPALQQVHIARKLLAMEAQKAGLSYLQYVQKIARQEKKVYQKAACRGKSALRQEKKGLMI